MIERPKFLENFGTALAGPKGGGQESEVIDAFGFFLRLSKKKPAKSNTLVEKCFECVKIYKVKFL